MNLRKPGRYEGPICFVPFDHDGPDRTWPLGQKRKLKGGWHYSTRVHRKYGEIPHKPLHLNDEDAYTPPFYEYADKTHKSWVEKHGLGQIVPVHGVISESEDL